MKTPKQYAIGSVEFRDTRECRWHDVCGDERIALLRAFYRKEPLPGGLVPWVYGYGAIRYEDVLWETAGERVTGPVC